MDKEEMRAALLRALAIVEAYPDLTPGQVEDAEQILQDWSEFTLMLPGEPSDDEEPISTTGWRLEAFWSDSNATSAQIDAHAEALDALLSHWGESNGSHLDFIEFGLAVDGLDLDE